MIEKVPSSTEVIEAFKKVRQIHDQKGEPTTHVMAVEIGGMNSLAPMYTAALMGLPVVDIDCMGRAYPEVQMVSNFING
jgi:DUF917 family protein